MIPINNSSKQWGWLTISIHWLTAMAVIGLFGLGLWMVELTYYDPWYKQGPVLHKSIGITLFLLTLIRFIWRLVTVVPDDLPSHRPWERTIAGVVHFALYLLLFMVMFSGYLISTADGRGVEFWGLFEIPATIYGIDKQEDIAGLIHLILASTLVGTALLHAGAALKHHFIDRDNTL
ncbi:MAG: cytochrome b, partial [Gammaproteobacteria bacterium]|nr:cytochrome b [Gammaproteobacteria bacterium]